MRTIGLRPVTRLVTISIDDQEVQVPEGSTILQACRGQQIETPTLCYIDTMHPVNVCRVCVVEVEGSRTLVPACSRAVEPGMKIHTDSERVQHSRRMVLEFLASSTDLSLVGAEVKEWMTRYGVLPDRYGPPSVAPAGARDQAEAGHHHPPDPGAAASVRQPVTIDNELYVRDYSKCILCYKCVEACGVEAQNTFAISVAGRGFDARISTEFTVPLPESACVYCGNCIGVCPTGALKSVREHEMREDGDWHPEQETVTTTICSFCGVGCNLELHVQQGQIVNVTSPADHSVTHGHLCIKGRFGFQHVQNLP